VGGWQPTLADLRRKLVRQGSPECLLFGPSGLEEENLRRAWSTAAAEGQGDVQSAWFDPQFGGWAKSTSTDFRFHSQEADIADVKPRNAQRDPRMFDSMPDCTPKRPARAMSVPQGFPRCSFSRGNLMSNSRSLLSRRPRRSGWQEAYSYPSPAKKNDAHDRILIFEDTERRRSPTSKRLWRNLEYCGAGGGTSAFGGIGIGAAPQPSFVCPVQRMAETRCGPRRSLLDGWGYQERQKHSTRSHGGPDAGLLVCHESLRIRRGKPGTPADSRGQRINRRHLALTSEKNISFFGEVFAEGTRTPGACRLREPGRLHRSCASFALFQHNSEWAGFQPPGRFAFQSIHLCRHRDHKGPDHRHLPWRHAAHGGNKSQRQGRRRSRPWGRMIYWAMPGPRNFALGTSVHGQHSGHRSMSTGVCTTPAREIVASHGNDVLLATTPGPGDSPISLPGPDGNVSLLDWSAKQGLPYTASGHWGPNQRARSPR